MMPLTLLLLLPFAVDEAAVSVLEVPDRGVRFTLVDLDGDGARELVEVGSDGLAVRRLHGGRYAPTPDARLTWTSPRLAWTFARDGAGRSVAVITEGDTLVFQRLGAKGFAPAGEPLEVRADLPRGRFRMDFLRDIDGDGREDLVLPVAGSYRLRLAGEGGYGEPIEIRLEAEVDHDLGDPNALSASFEQDVEIPWFELRDLDGDGDRDLVAETGDRVWFHLAAPVLSTEPSWSLDLAALREELPERGGLVLDDVFANVPAQVEWRVLDLDGKPPHDLLLQVGGKFRTWLGGSTTGPTGRPSQLLKTSGNVLTFTLADVDHDGDPDLQMLRAEKLSLARVVRWLILPGALEFDLFTYANEGGTFGLRPARRQKVRIEFPRLLSLVDRVESFEEEMEASAEVPALRVDLGGDGAQDDVADVRGRELLLFEGRAPVDDEHWTGGDGEDDFLRSLLGDFDDLEDGAVKTIELDDIESWSRALGQELRDACGEATADERIPLDVELVEDVSLHAFDLDGRGGTDFVITGEDAEGLLRVVFVVRPPRPAAGPPR